MISLLNGKRCFGWLRSARSDQRRLAFQRGAIRAFATLHNMEVVGEINASQRPSLDIEEQIDNLVARKKRKNDFDFLVVTTLDRLGRDGALALHARIFNLARHDIGVVAVFSGPYGNSSVVQFKPNQPPDPLEANRHEEDQAEDTRCFSFYDF